MTPNQVSEELTTPNTSKIRAWLFGNLVWLFGILDRSSAAIVDGSLSLGDLGQLAMISCFWLGWLSLKPKPKSRNTALAKTQFAQVLLQSTRKLTERESTN